MRKTILFAAAVSVMAAPSMAIAASKGKKDAAPAPAAQPAAPGTSQEDIQRGVIVIRSFAGALNSDQLNNEQKGAIVACLYNNPVRQISVATGKVLASSRTRRTMPPCRKGTARPQRATRVSASQTVTC